MPSTRVISFTEDAEHGNAEDSAVAGNGPEHPPTQEISASAPEAIDTEKTESPSSRESARVSKRRSFSPSFVKRSRKGASFKTETNPHIHKHVVSIKGFSPSQIEVTLNVEIQHTLSWDVEIKEMFDRDGDGVPDRMMPEGSCNLYLFPAITTARTDGVDGTKTIVAEGGMLKTLQALIVAVAGDPTCGLFDHPDLVGAMPMHAITVANTPAAIVTSRLAYTAAPHLITQVHAKHRAGFPLFTGESSLHICCVNQQEDLLCYLVELAVREVPPAEVRELFKSQAMGVFFDEMPMRFYGGTALAYACCFDLQRAILAMLESRLISLNDRANTCVVSGFMPIHAITANSLEATYDYVTSGLPEEFRADPNIRSGVGRIPDLNMNNLLPMQLAAKLGDQDYVKFMLRKQTSILWVWGPVTAHSVNLTGIDSAGEGSGDIMDLVARMDACKGCTELLLDSFMQGQIHKLFQQKWHLYGYKLHYVRRLLDFILICLMCMIAMLLKNDITTDVTALTIALLLVMALTTTEEVLVLAMWIPTNLGEGKERLPMRKFLPQLSKFCASHGIYLLLLGYGCTAAACFLILSTKFVDPVANYYNLTDAEHAAIYMGETASGAVDQVVGRMLKARGGGAATGSADGDAASLGFTPVESGDLSSMYFLKDVDDSAGILWILLGVGCFANIYYFNIKIFIPFEGLNIFQISVIKILRQDISQFLILFGSFMINFFFTLYVLYPRAGEVYLPFVMKYNSWYSALHSLLDLGFTGSPPDLNIEADNFAHLTPAQMAAIGLWFVFYLFYILYSIVLLMNLLIALLSFTFDTVREESTLHARISFAQCIQRLELLARVFHMPMKVGDLKGDTYTIDFRSVGESVETPQGLGSNDPFAPSAKDDVLAQDRLESKVEDLSKQLKVMQKELLRRLPKPPEEEKIKKSRSSFLAMRMLSQRTGVDAGQHAGVANAANGAQSGQLSTRQSNEATLKRTSTPTNTSTNKLAGASLAVLFATKGGDKVKPKPPGLAGVLP